jgi:Zn-dependent protease with chaperone function
MISYALAHITANDAKMLFMGMFVLLIVSIIYSILGHGAKKIFTFVKYKVAKRG